MYQLHDSIIGLLRVIHVTGRSVVFEYDGVQYYAMNNIANMILDQKAEYVFVQETVHPHTKETLRWLAVPSRF